MKRSPCRRLAVSSALLLMLLTPRGGTVAEDEQEATLDLPSGCTYMSIGPERLQTESPGSVTAGPLLSPGRYMVWVSPIASGGRLSGVEPTAWRSHGPFDFDRGVRYLINVADGTPPEVELRKEDPRLVQYDSPDPDAAAYFRNATTTDAWYAVAVCKDLAWWGEPPPVPYDNVGPRALQRDAPGSVFAGKLLEPHTYWIWVSPTMRDRGLQPGRWFTYGPYEFEAGKRYLVTIRDGAPPELTVVPEDARLMRYGSPGDMAVPYWDNATETEIWYAVAIARKSVDVPPDWQVIQRGGVRIQIPGDWTPMEGPDPEKGEGGWIMGAMPDPVAGVFLIPGDEAASMVDDLTNRTSEPAVVNGRPGTRYEGLADEDPPVRIIVLDFPRRGEAPRLFVIFAAQVTEWGRLGPIFSLIQASLRLP